MSILFLIQQNNPTALVQRTIPERKDNIVSVSSLVEEQLPHFVRVDHPRTVAFMEAYYEWMEEKDETLYSAFILHEYKDIDETIDGFVKYFRRQYLDRFPKDLAIDKSTGAKVDEKRLIKRIKQFYGAKGTEKSYRLLFRILYDTEIEFYYPKKDIIKASHGKWIQEKSLKLTSLVGTSGGTSGKLWSTPETIIKQDDASGKFIAEAKVSRVSVYETALTTISEIFLNDINGIFKSDVPVTFANNFSEVPYPILQNVSVNIDVYGNKEKGRGYKVGDKVTITSSVTGGTIQGNGASGIVNTVSIDGGIISVELQECGLGYRHDSGATFDYAIETLTGTGAGLTSSSGALFDNPGYFFDANGHPSSTKHLQDSFFYQDYSYEIKTEITLESYKQAVLDLVHPAGTKLFNRIYIRKNHPTNTVKETSSTAYDISTFGHYLPYTFNTVENLRHNSQGVDLYPFGYNPSATGAPATAVDAIDTTGYVASGADASFTISIPTSAGGLGGTAITFLLDENVITPPSGSGPAWANIIKIGTYAGAETDALAAGYIIKAINAVTDARILYAASGNGQAGYDIGVTAKQGSSDTQITLTMDTGSNSGNISSALASVSGLNIIDVTDFIGGSTYGTANETGVTAHQAAVARDRVYWGLVFNDEPGRTAQSDGYTAGNTYAFPLPGASDGTTWDPGITGPLYHLSQGIVMNYGLSGASSDYTILATAEAGDFANQGSYWVIYQHPNSRGLNTIPSGTTFANVKLEPFFHMTYPGGYTNSTGGVLTTSETIHGIVLQ